MYEEYKWAPIALARNRILRIFEPLQPFVLLRFAELLESDTFIDIGANIGAYSLFLSRVPGLREVHAFEAAPKTFLALQQTVNENGLKDLISCHNEAVSDMNGSITFRIVGDYSGANWVAASTIHKVKDFSEDIDVPSVKIDDKLSFSSRSVCIKIDVEGHELPVLRGAEKLLVSNKCIVQMEVYGEDGKRDEASEFLLAHGYRRLLKIGPDCYFSNDSEKISPQVVQDAVEFAAAALIASNREHAQSESTKPKSVRRKLLPGVTVELSGAPLASTKRFFSLFGYGAQR